MYRSQRKGFSTIEILVVSAMLLVITLAISTSLRLFFVLARHTADATQASLLLEEGYEALLVMRDIDWDGNIGLLAFDTEYNLVWDGGAYLATLAPESGTYRRTVVFEEVTRSAADVVASSGTVDPNTWHATLSVYRTADDELLARGDMLIHNTYAP